MLELNHNPAHPRLTERNAMTYPTHRRRTYARRVGPWRRASLVHALAVLLGAAVMLGAATAAALEALRPGDGAPALAASAALLAFGAVLTGTAAVRLLLEATR